MVDGGSADCGAVEVREVVWPSGVERPEGFSAMDAFVTPGLLPLLGCRQTASRGRVSQRGLLSCLMGVQGILD
jgi:hypothetical protein